MSFFSWRKDSFGFLNPYIIAEIGVNHAGDKDLAKKQILLAKKAGAHAVKFQMYKASLIASREHSPAYWDTNKETTLSQFELFSKYDSFDISDYEDLANYSHKIGIDFACTPFDLLAVEKLTPLVPFFKIASADITNIPLLHKVVETKKPIILSVGASTWEEIDKALAVLKENGQKEIALLHCVLNYPTPYNHAQMSLQDEMQKRYGQESLIGYSDHIPPLENGELPALDLSVLRGAVIIEKHFSHDITLPGNDHYHAFSPEILARWIEKLSLFRVLYGGAKDRHLSWESMAIANARRRIYLTKDKNKGESINPEDLIALRGDKGLGMEFYDKVLGKTLKIDKKQNDYIEEKDIEYY